ncbi:MULTISPECIES: viroplasmin family protein [unclassified Aureispira]|uniref:ribonuclease H1 domain-containing protein n=1 Tax=unclassified Aureispira TaxID=2649989 RepID=UPI000695D5CE|nr:MULTISPECIES: ribonuclease H family protein [unclassified Aureispira]WMX12236.1 ribonuclease H family protein [Aureispira sp. CCB-E]
MAKKNKFYVVWEGHETGIFKTWKECQKHIKGYAGAKYKSFGSLREAEDAFAGSYFDAITPSKKKTIDPSLAGTPIWKSIAVDAACSGNPGLMEYQGVDTSTGKRLFHVGPLQQGTNNIGEFLALVHGLAFLKQHNSNLPIYTDSKIAMGWIKAKKCRTKVAKTKANVKIFDLITRGENWLKNNSFETEILKWETKAWGEIPADFGRK